jgi:predicted aspartyl protease
MSTFTYAVRVANPRGSAAPVEVKCLVDTGAMFTCLPAPVLEALGVTAQWRVPIKLADGRQEEWSAAEILMTIDGRTLHTTCLFGPADALALLGAVSLEQFALSADPLARTLVRPEFPWPQVTFASCPDHNGCAPR